ncbi:MAG TPA: tetratricopeptide repeat protein [Candidatus Elarobacter sp.]|nr:tetratricopeptide repeat protein [Candidatus Elarobacter sp.]
MVTVDLDAMLARAAALEARGELDAAVCAYLDVLVRDRFHREAMLAVGALFAAKHTPELARAVFAEAAERHPGCVAAHVGLGNALLELDDRAGARRAFANAVAADPEDRDAYMHLGLVLERDGERDAAAAAWRRAYADGALPPLPFRGTGEPVRLMAVCSALGGNAPLDRVIDPRVFQRTTLFAEGYRDALELPRGALLLNAIADADLAPRALDVMERIEAASGTIALNRPAHVRATARVANAKRMAAIDGVVAPRVASFARDLLASPAGRDAVEAAGFAWPLLLRSAGFHNGKHFVRVDEPGGLAAAAAALPGDELLAIAFADVRGEDGMVRKYRVLTIGGELYPLHLALSHDWKVHYVTAAMDERQAYRDEERAFLTDMTGALGAGAVATLQRVADVLALDYAGMDFALDRDGRIVLFEANAAMVIAPPKSDAQWEYRRAPARRAVDATQALLRSRAAALG